MENVNILLKSYEDNKLSHFGAAVALLSSGDVVYFGGCTAEDELEQMSVSNKTYYFSELRQIWLPLIVTTPPPARASHAMVSIDEYTFFLFGGTSSGFTLVPNDLWKLDLRQVSSPVWSVVSVSPESAPCPRFGHSLVYLKPYLIVFGGSDGRNILKDVWLLNLEISYLEWKQIKFPNLFEPPSRVYHSASICHEDVANRMIIVYGGLNECKAVLDDLWGLRLHRNGTWTWTKAKTKTDEKPKKTTQSDDAKKKNKNDEKKTDNKLSPITIETEPTVGRYQHTSFCLGRFFVIMGGRGPTEHQGPLPSWAYDTSESIYIY